MFTKSAIYKKAYNEKVRKDNGLSWSDSIKNAKIQLQIEKLSIYVDSCKDAKIPFQMYKKETFEINDLKKKLIRPEVASGVIELDNGELEIDFAMF